MMTPITAVIILNMSTGKHLRKRLAAMRMTIGTTEQDKMYTVVRKG
jgi:hypothetical protein